MGAEAAAPSSCSCADALPRLARAALRRDWAAIDPELPAMLEVLKTVGAHECWHKRGTFGEHLLAVYTLLKCHWGAEDVLARCALFHSAYSNSFVNLAIFKPDVERERVARIIGREAEELVHRFCVVPRQRLIQVDLLDRLWLDNADLVAPPGGMTVPHIRTGEPLHVDLFELGQFLILTMADFAEQLYSWQDALFGNTDGRLRLEGCPAPEPRVLWPGPMKPGLWASAVSRMGRLAASCKQQLADAGDPRAARLVLPPVFDGCTKILGEDDQQLARDLYWRAVTDPALQSPQAAAQQRELFEQVVGLNPWVAEPHLMLAQLHLHAQAWQEAEAAASRALQLFMAWGTAWDKRMGFEAWVAWTRVCLEAAMRRAWCDSPMAVLSSGLVGGL